MIKYIYKYKLNKNKYIIYEKENGDMVMPMENGELKYFKKEDFENYLKNNKEFKLYQKEEIKEFNIPLFLRGEC